MAGRMAENPMAWMLEVNGYIVDARQMPRDFQEEAFRRGFRLHPVHPLTAFKKLAAFMPSHRLNS
jgi:hypothetical protein